MFSFWQKKPSYLIRLNEETGVPPIPVYEKKIIIGRNNQHVLALPDNSVSRNHIEVNFRNGVIYVTDLGTANGTTIDGEKIPPHKPIPYAEGQDVVLGQSEVTIRFERLPPG